MQTDTSLVLYLHYVPQHDLLSPTKSVLLLFSLLSACKMCCSIPVNEDGVPSLPPGFVCHLISSAYVPGFFTCRDGVHAQSEI